MYPLSEHYLPAIQAFIDRVQFAAAALTLEGAGIPDPVARLEQLDGRARLADDARRVHAENDRFATLWARATANPAIDRIDRHRADRDQEISGAEFRHWHVEVEQGLGVIEGMGLLESNGFQLAPPG